jgi:hypothetical protein
MTHSNGNQVTDKDIDMAYNSTVDTREVLHGQCAVSIAVSHGIFQDDFENWPVTSNNNAYASQLLLQKNIAWQRHIQQYMVTSHIFEQTMPATTN